MNFTSVEQDFEEDNKNFLRDEDGNILDIPVDQNTSQNYQLDELLETFDLREVKPYLERAEITFESLKYLSKEDIKEAIPPIGLRACFREKLFYWRKSKHGIDDDSLAETIANKVIYWLQNQSNIGTTTTTATPNLSLTTPISNSHLSKSLKLILEDTLKGKSIISFYEKNLQLTDSFRRDLINIILEDIFYREVKLSPKDFTTIVDEILENFPCEIREYYFIPRRRKANPGGKLWDKYVNQRSKRVRSSGILKDNLEASNPIPQNTYSELDEPVLQALKVSLTKEISNFDQVKDKWQRTFLLRQKELKTSKSHFEFLSNWPLYSNNRFGELVNIDFKLLHPNKNHLLLSKWSEFMDKIGSYYNLHIKDKKSKEILINSRGISDQSSLDCIHAILLNAVILPTAHFSDNFGKNSRKISIADAIESFVIHCISMNNYEKVILDFRDKYYNSGLTVQPIILVVGQSIYSLKEFYVYFDKKQFKFCTFLECLDICFKIMQTLSLEYPKSCKGPWVFIQEYFYEIKPVTDDRLPSICTLLNFLNSQ